MTTGSLGQGLSIAAGIAQAYLLNEKKNTVYCIMGDGESQEGQNWEAILYAAQQKLGNLILFVDDNKAQIDGYVSQINEMERNLRASTGMLLRSTDTTIMPFMRQF